MKPLDLVDPAAPNATGSALIKRAFVLGLHGSTQAVACALGVAPDTASRLLSPTRRDARDATHAEVGAFVDLVGTLDLLHVCASLHGATVTFPDAGSADAMTSVAAATAKAATLMQELIAIDADGKRTAREQAEAVQTIAEVERELAKAKAAALAWKVTA